MGDDCLLRSLNPNANGCGFDLTKHLAKIVIIEFARTPGKKAKAVTRRGHIEWKGKGHC